jgi:hypothetical protein
MKSLTRRGVLVSGAALAVGGISGTAEAATGSVSLHIVSAGFIIGVGGGDGVLMFRGVNYPLSLGGISAGATIGVSSADLVGRAYHLHDPHDIEGVYSAIGAGVAVAAGATAVTLQNSKGVVLRLQGRQVGFKISFALSGMTINLK